MPVKLVMALNTGPTIKISDETGLEKEIEFRIRTCYKMELGVDTGSIPQAAAMAQIYSALDLGTQSFKENTLCQVAKMWKDNGGKAEEVLSAVILPTRRISERCAQRWCFHYAPIESA